MINEIKPIRVEQYFKNTSKEIWDALTNIDKMKQWYFPIISSFKPEVGFKTEFVVEIEDRVFIHQWEITDVIPEQKIAYQWTFGGYVGKGISEFKLIKVGEQTKLQLTFTVLEPFPQNIPEFKRESGENGWKYLINDALKKYLDNTL